MFLLAGMTRLALLAESMEMILFEWFHLDLFDLLFVVTAIVFNIQIMGIYIASRRKQAELLRMFGAVTLILALPLAVVFLYKLVTGSEQWIIAGFMAIFFYLAVELLGDYIFKIDFRSRPILHTAYIILFYLVEFSFITIAYSIDKVPGYLVSLSFWALLLCLIYASWPSAAKFLQRGEQR
jgi:hypothetical protein